MQVKLCIALLDIDDEFVHKYQCCQYHSICVYMTIYMYSTVCVFMQLEDFYAELKWEFHTWGKSCIHVDTNTLAHIIKGLVYKDGADIAIRYICTCINPLKLPNVGVYGFLR